MSRPDESARIEAHAERFPESVPGVDADFDALARQIEDDAILGTCDWGSCGNQQVGWARTKDDDDWLAICDPCRKRGTSKDAPGAYPVHEFASFAQVWRWTRGEPLAAFLRRCFGA